MLTPTLLGTTTVSDSNWNPWSVVPITTTKSLYLGELDSDPWTVGCKIVAPDDSVGGFVALPAEYSDGIALSSYRVLLVGLDIPGLQDAGPGKMRFNLAYLDVSSSTPAVLWSTTTDWLETPTENVVNYVGSTAGYDVVFSGIDLKEESPNLHPIGDDAMDEGPSTDGTHWLYTLHLTALLRPSWNAGTPSLDWAEYVCNQTITFDDFDTTFLAIGSDAIEIEPRSGSPKASVGWLTYTADHPNFAHCRMADSDTWEFRLVRAGYNEESINGMLVVGDPTDFAPTALTYYMATNPPDNMALNWESWTNSTGVEARRSATFGGYSTHLDWPTVVGNPSVWGMTDGETVDDFLTVNNTSYSSTISTQHPDATISGFIAVTTLDPDTSTRFDFYSVDLPDTILNPDGSIGGDRNQQPPVEVTNPEEHDADLYDQFYNACQIGNNKLLVWYKKDTAESALHTTFRLIGRGGWKGAGLDYEVLHFDGGNVTVGATTSVQALSSDRAIALTWGVGLLSIPAPDSSSDMVIQLRATYLDVSGSNPVLLWEDEWTMPATPTMAGYTDTYNVGTFSSDVSDSEVIAVFGYSRSSYTSTKKKTYQHIWQADITVSDVGGSVDTNHETIYEGTDTSVVGWSEGRNYGVLMPHPGTQPYIYYLHKGAVYGLDVAWGEKPRLGLKTDDLFIERLKEAGWSRKGLWQGWNYISNGMATIHARLPDYEESDYHNVSILDGEGFIIIDTGQYGWSTDITFPVDQEAYQSETYFSQPRRVPKRLHLAWVQVWPAADGDTQPPKLVLFDVLMATARIWDGEAWVMGIMTWDGTAWRPAMIYDGENWV